MVISSQVCRCGLPGRDGSRRISTARPCPYAPPFPARSLSQATTGLLGSSPPVGESTLLPVSNLSLSPSCPIISTFACEGITGPARNACDGTAVLIGLKFPLETPIYVYPLGLLGFVVGSHALALLLLTFYHPGGVKHAASQSTDEKKVAQVEKATKAQPKVISSREGVDVKVERLGLTVSSRSLLKRGARVERAILIEVDAFFPSGKVSVIMGPSGVSFFKRR